MLSIPLTGSVGPLDAAADPSDDLLRAVVHTEHLDEDALERGIRETGSQLVRVDEHLPFAVVRTPDVDGLSSALTTAAFGEGASADAEPALEANAHRIRVELDARGGGAASSTGDPMSGDQWALDVLDAPQVWGIEEGSSRVTVAVVDSGIDETHPDLDDVPISQGTDYVELDADPNDEYGHGTHIAGIIAAERANNVGIAGMARVSLIDIRVLDENNAGWCSDMGAGIAEAAARGADVINLSLHCSVDSFDLRAGVEAAAQRGALVVAAAGNFQNSGLEHRCVTYPGAYDEAIAVAAIQSDKTVAGFSCQGPEVELAAPGADILSTLPGNSYARWYGTSMATPYVGASAALLMSYDPLLTAEDVRGLLAQSAEDLGSSGRDAVYGHGLVDPLVALQTHSPVL